MKMIQHKYVYLAIITGVVLCLQVQLIERVNITDVHFFFIQLGFVEVLKRTGQCEQNMLFSVVCLNTYQITIIIKG